MSGPITVLMTPGQVLPVLLAASAIRAAAAVREAAAQAADLRAAHDGARRAAGRRQAEAGVQGMAALQARAEAAEQRLRQLAELSTRLGAPHAQSVAVPLRPESQDYAALAGYVHAIEAFALEVQHAVLTATASDVPGSDGPGAFVVPEAELAAMTTPAAPTLSARLLARIAHLGPVPEEIEALAHELDATPAGERADLLAVELRRRVQLHAQRHLQRQVQEAQALVVAQSLADLGYEVEGIDTTLFVEGGVAHFRKSHWGDYMVRLRVQKSAADGAQSINFNVVRAVDDAADEAGSASVQDHLAEDRWCAEFPALLEMLGARGIPLAVTRRLEAGELPVQRVTRSNLPHFADADEAQPAQAAPLKARPLP